MEVSVIGLGTVKFGRNQAVKYPQTFSLPTDQEIKHLLALAAECGINFLDTAPAYGSSEERLGQLLERRHDWIISTKVGEAFSDGVSTFNFSAHAIQQSIDRSLQRLRTDYLDIVLVHSNGDDEKIIQQDQVFLTLASLKKSGKIRAYGMSTKTVAGGLAVVNEADADVVMVTYHPLSQDDQVVIQSAYQKQKGVIIKKALASGHLPFSFRDSMRFIFKEPGVSSVVIGTINADHLRENVRQLVRMLLALS